MKKIFTLLFSVGAFATSFAQTGHQTKRNDQYATAKSNTEYRKFDNHRDNIYTFSAKEKNIEIAKINNDFNFKVTSIISNHRIKKHEKKLLVQKAQTAKDQQIQAVNLKFDNKFNTAFNEHVKEHDRYNH